MPKDAPMNVGAALDEPIGSRQRVSGMQAKLHRWAAADPGRRFDDLLDWAAPRFSDSYYSCCQAACR